MSWSELHCHSAYSFMDGASLPDTLAAQAGQLGYAALALTDHDNLAGIVPHAQACATAGIRPIAGVEVTLADESHLTLLARDAEGFSALTRIVSHAHLSGDAGKPSLTLDDLARYTVGLECLTGCRHGTVPRLLLAGDEAGAQATLHRLGAIFGAGHVWVELQRAALPDDNRLCYRLAQAARRLGLPLVATGNSHYAHPEDRPLQDVLVCIRRRLPLSEARPHLRPGGSWHLPTQADMRRRFQAYPAALRGAAELADRCGFALSHIEATFPRFPTPDGHTSLSYLHTLVRAGAADRYGTSLPAPVRARLEHELDVVAALDKADYFLVIWDIVRHARAQGILCQGRGSSVGSVVCFCLGITAVEPISHRLSFERFLSLGRRDPPDIDIDLPADRADRHGPARDAVIRYALTRWPGHAALVCTTVTYQARSAVRDVGMALGLSGEQLDLLAREGDDLSADDLSAASNGMAERAEGVPARDDAPVPAVLRRLALPPGPVLHRLHHLVRRIVGLPRHLSQHPGGVVITARPLAQVAPLQPARMPGRVILQWDKDAAEDAGLVKIDLLGLGMLGAIDRAFSLLERQTGTRPALHGFQCDDPRVYDALCRADTVGVFQVESRAQISLCLPQLQPRCYDDIVVAVALIRPGPVQGHAVHPSHNVAKLWGQGLR
jgi:error-prone DNA polymerase